MGVTPGIKQIGKYTVLDVIGTGGMGIVYRAHDPAIGRTVAIKMLRQGEATGGVFDRFFSRERKSTGNLHHKNIVTVYDSGEQDGNPYLVMEFLEGEPASKIIADRRQMPLVDKLDLVIQVCDGLQYAHDRNVIHRDIKPANIIVLSDGTAKIVDFGVARIAGGESSIVQTGQLVGSLSYMSPEQINSIPIDARSDVFSTGVMLYELLTYELPFKGGDAAATFVKILREEPAPLSQFSQDFPAALQPVVSRALAKHLNDRYQTAEEFGFDLLSVQKDLKAITIADLMKRAEAAMHRGDLERVRLHLQEVIRLDRQNERANRLLREVRRAIQQQQRTSQVVQMRSQAQVALAGAQYEEALACADQALRLDPADTESIRLCDEIRNAINKVKAVREALNRAESALFAGDFDEAKEAVEESLRLDPADSEARAMSSVINKELAERSRRQRIQGFVDQARREIAERKFSNALDALHQAEELDPSDSNVHELLQWALRGQEQEKRRRFLQDITDQIEKALHAGDFSSACTISDMGLSRFPDEATLLRLKAISEKQREIAERRRFVNDQSLAVKALTEQGKLPDAVLLLTSALEKYPGEPNLESLLASTRAEIERLEYEREQAELQQALQRAEAEARARVTQEILNLSVELRRSLDARTSVEDLLASSRQLRNALDTQQIDEHAREVAGAVLSEVETRLRAREQAFAELDQLRRLLDQPHDTTVLGEAENRLLSINANFPQETGVQQQSADLARTLGRLRERRDRALAALGTLAGELDRTPTSEITAVFRRAREIATGFAADAQLGALLQQIEFAVTRRLERHAELLRELARLSSELAASHSLEDVARVVERARSSAAADPDDPQVADQVRQLEGDAARLRKALEVLLREMRQLGQLVAAARTIQEAESLVPKIKLLTEQRTDFQELQESAKRLLASIQGRRVEHDLIAQELESVRASLPVLDTDEELHAASSRAQQCVQSHPADPAIQSASAGIQDEVSRLLRERAEFRARTLECDQALRAAEDKLHAQDWDAALAILLPLEPRNPDRADLRLQITVARKALELQRAEQERFESEKIARERAEAEARARQAAIAQAEERARRLLGEDRGDEAAQVLANALVRFPADAKLQNALLWLRNEMDRRRAEREQLERERLERERISREKAEAELRARRTAADQAINEASQLLARGRDEECLQRLRAALERDPANHDLRAALHATQTEISRRRAEAERERERLERLAREKAEAESRARRIAAENAIKDARRLLSQGQEDTALQSLGTALNHDPANQELASHLKALESDVARLRAERERAQRERNERDRQEKERLARERLAREQAEAQARMLKAAADEAISCARDLHQRQQTDEAIRILQSALELDPANLELRTTCEAFQSELARRRAEQARQQREQIERERAARARAEAEARSLRAASDAAIKQAQEMVARKRADDALSRLETALQRDPENAALRTALLAMRTEVAQQRAEQERLENQRRELERVAREKAEAEARSREEAADRALESSQAAIVRNQADEAVRILQKALTTDGGNSNLRSALLAAQSAVDRKRDELKREEKERARQQKRAIEQTREASRKAQATTAPSESIPAAVASRQTSSAPLENQATSGQQQPTVAHTSRTRLFAIAGGGAAVLLAVAGAFLFHSGSPERAVTFVSTPGDARLTVDGTATTCPGTCVIKLKPGGHMVALQEDGYVPLSQQVQIASSDTNRVLELRMQPQTKPSSAGNTPPPPPPPTPQQRPASSADRSVVSQPRQPASRPAPLPQAAQTPIQAPSAPAPDLAAWNAIKETRDLNALHDFRSHYPASPYASQARDRMDELTWPTVHASSQSSDLQQYLKDFPEGHHTTEARDQLASLQPKPPLAAQQARPLQQPNQTSPPQEQNLSAQRDRELIAQTVEAYRSAYEAKNLEALSAVWIETPRQKLEKTFKYAEKIRVTLTPGTVTINGDSATLPCRQRIEITVASAKSSNDATILFSLKRQQGKWVIVSAR